jgi:hypothetical protein
VPSDCTACFTNCLPSHLKPHTWYVTGGGDGGGASLVSAAKTGSAKSQMAVQNMVLMACLPKTRRMQSVAESCFSSSIYVMRKLPEKADTHFSKKPKWCSSRYLGRRFRPGNGGNLPRDKLLHNVTSAPEASPELFAPAMDKLILGPTVGQSK